MQDARAEKQLCHNELVHCLHGSLPEQSCMRIFKLCIEMAVGDEESQDIVKIPKEMQDARAAKQLCVIELVSCGRSSSSERCMRKFKLCIQKAVGDE